jgi:hypothetical protein
MPGRDHDRRAVRHQHVPRHRAPACSLAVSKCDIASSWSAQPAVMTLLFVNRSLACNPEERPPVAIVVTHERLSRPEWAELSVTNRCAPRSKPMEQAMTDNEKDHLRTELEHGKALITQSRKLMARKRAIIADAEKHFADSFDRLADSQKLARS